MQEYMVKFGTVRDIGQLRRMQVDVANSNGAAVKNALTGEHAKQHIIPRR